MHALVFMWRKWRIGVFATLGIRWTRIALGGTIVLTPSEGHFLVEAGVSLGPVWFTFECQVCTHAAIEEHEEETVSENN